MTAAPAMRFAILGAGATGGFLGGRLARAGADVTLIARGPHLQAMREHGLRVIEAGGADYVVHPALTDDLAVLGAVDAVFVTLKAHSLPAIAERLAAALGPKTAVVSAQNGIPWWYFERYQGELAGLHLESVDPGGVIGSSIDPARVVACVVYPATTLVRPGVVQQVEGERFSLGELDGSISERCQAIAAALQEAGLKAPIQAAIRDELWVKLLGNAVFNPISALTRATLDTIATSPVIAPVVRQAMEEVDAVARRVGVEIPVSIDRRIRGAARVGAHRTSMLQDLEAGRPLEIDALCGSVVELADRLGVPVPHLRTLYAGVKLLEETVRA
ncbi:MAG TPA: 2-dehydropantoate 2-reductase [Candidatus Limnocylindrales bacterium]|nr:2-dehydropantoate 2-reductase [Candidatus Limnocylindrales bacterium]